MVRNNIESAVSRGVSEAPPALQSGLRPVAMRGVDGEHALLDQLRTAVDHSFDAVSMVDSQGRIEFANPAFEVATGFSPGALLGMGFQALVAGSSASDPYAELLENMLRGKAWAGQLTLRTSDERLVTLETRLVPLLGPGGTVSHGIQLQREPLQALGTPSSKCDAGAPRPTSIVAHDLNNCLSVILNYGFVLDRHLQRHHLLRPIAHEMQSAAQRAAELARQFLSFARREATETKTATRSAAGCESRRDCEPPR